MEIDNRIVETYLNNSSEGVFILNSDQKTLYANNVCRDITGRNLLTEEKPPVTGGGWHDPSFYDRLWIQVEKSGLWQGEVWDKRGDQLYAVNLKLIKINKEDQLCYLGILRDITQELKAQKDLIYLETVDPLTQITNRRAGERILDEHLQLKKTETTAVIFLDIDDFHIINETFGHVKGDEVLRDAASRLSETQWSLFHFGSDRFILYMDYEELEILEEEIFSIIDLFQEPFFLDNHELFLSVNIGVAVHPMDGKRAETLIHNAEFAMNESRNSGNNTYAFYEEEMNASVLERFSLMADLRRSLERRELELCYQPQVDALSNTLWGTESLLRWNSLSRGFVSPGLFIPEAEKSGLIIPIGEWILREAFRQYLSWQDEGLQITLAINISAVQFNDKKLVSVIKNIFHGKVDTSFIELEITEGAVMDDIDNSVNVMKKLKNMGFRLVIDDFGTGYSSLSYLKKFPVDKLKIDQSFVRSLPLDRGDGAIVKTIISLAENLGLKVLAEGVENREQLEFLKKNGCSLIQGYYYSKPLSGEKIMDFSRGLIKK